MWVLCGWFSSEEKQLKKIDLHVQLCPCRQSSLPITPFLIMSWSILTAAKLVPPLLELALALPQFSPFRVHSSSLRCFFSLTLGVNYMDIKLFIEKYSFSCLIEVPEGYIHLWCQNSSTKCKVTFGHKSSTNNSEEHRGQRESKGCLLSPNSCVCVCAFLTHAPLECLRCSVLQIRTVPLFGSLWHVYLYGRVWTSV